MLFQKIFQPNESNNPGNPGVEFHLTNYTETLIFNTPNMDRNRWTVYSSHLGHLYTGTEKGKRKNPRIIHHLEHTVAGSACFSVFKPPSLTLPFSTVYHMTLSNSLSFSPL